MKKEQQTLVEKIILASNHLHKAGLSSNANHLVISGKMLGLIEHAKTIQRRKTFIKRLKEQNDCVISELKDSE